MMRKARLAAVATTIAFAPSLPCLGAEGADAPLDKLDPARIAGSVLTDENLSLIFGLLRQSIAAAAEGRTPPPPPAELAKRMDEAGQVLRKEGAAAALSILDMLEGEVKRSPREDLRD